MAEHADITAPESGAPGPGPAPAIRDGGPQAANQAALARIGITDDADLINLVDASLDCIKIVERDGRLSFFNTAGMCAMEIDGFEAVDGALWSDLWPADSQALIEDAVDRALHGESVRLEAFCPTALGRPRWWDVSVSPMIRDGEVMRLLSISRDITDRVRREQMAEERERAAIRELERAKRELEGVAATPAPELSAPIIATVGEQGERERAARESRRLDALARLGLEEGLPDNGHLDALAALAARLADTPSAMISIIGGTTQWYRAQHGADLQSCAREDSFCHIAIQTPEVPFIVEDALNHSLVSGNPFVTVEDGIRAYAGIPLLTSDGHAIGALCALDTRPRAFTLSQIDALKTLATSVVSEIERERMTRRSARLELINAELKHRMGNSYAQVSSLVGLLSQTARDKDTLARTLRENITALSRTQARIAQGGWVSLDLCSLMEETIRVSDEDVRIDCTIDPNFDISPQAAFMLTLALQELATNSRKHGLLRRDEGRVRLDVHTDDTTLVLDWIEASGEDTAESERDLPATPSSGFGQKLLTRIVPLGLGGSATLEMSGNGMHYRLELPRARVAVE